jgi:hypothetical protein
MGQMKVLVACEYSGRVRDAFLKKGHDAMSCDLLPSESFMGQHYQGNVFDIIDDGWDLMIAHPPCTYLTVAANKYFLNNPERWQQRLDAMMFVYRLMNADIHKIAIENPKGVITSHIRKADQYIQPYWFGCPEPKMTGLWLKNLPKLDPTNIVEPEYVLYNSKRTKSGKSRYGSFGKLGSGKGKERSLTYQGIANAMADQWG